MTRLNSKKMLTVLISVAMIFSALAVVSLMAQPAYASGTGLSSITPTVFGETSGVVTATTVEAPNAGSSVYTSGSTIYFYLSTKDSSSGIIGSYIGTYTLPAGDTAIPGGATFTLFSSATSVAAGSYYVLSSNSASPTAAGASFPEYVAVTIISTQPSIALEVTKGVTASQPITTTYGSTVYITGSGWDPSSTVDVYLSYVGGSSPGSSAISFTTTSAGNVPTGTSFTVTDLSGTVSSSGSYLASAYSIVAYEAETNGATYPQGGVTADTTMNVAPSITISPGSISGSASSSTLTTITGHGFVSGEKIAAFPTGSSGTSPITVQSGSSFVNAYYATGVASVASVGTFTISSVTIPVKVASENSVAGQEVQITATGPATTDAFSDVLYVSTPGVSPALYVSPTTGIPGSGLYAVVTGFTGGGTVSVLFDGSALGSPTTLDVNGFGASSSSLVVPSVQAGTYTLIATDGTYSATATFTVTASTVEITDSASNPVNGEYVLGSAVASKIASSPTADTVEISVTGLAAYAPVTVSDTGFATTTYATSNLFSVDTQYYNTNSAYLFTPSEGFIGTTGFTANGLGEFTLTYTPDYAASTATGTSFNVAVTSTVSGSATYYAVGLATVTLGATSYKPTSTVTATLTGLIPAGSATAPTAAGFEGPYALSLDGSTSPLTLTSGGLSAESYNAFAASSGGSATVSFAFSSETAGVHTLAVVPYASTLTVNEALGTNYELISSSASTTGTAKVNSDLSTVVGGSGTSGSPYTGYPALTSADNNGYGLEVDFYDMQANAAVTISVYGSTGTIVSSIPTSATTDANGAATVFIPFPAAVGGHTFGIVFSQTVGSTSTTITGSTVFYEDLAAVSFEPSSFALNGGSVANDYKSYFSAEASSGTNVTFYANSLLPNTEYDVFLGTSAAGTFSAGEYVTSFVTGSAGDFVTGVIVPIPSTEATGTYYIDVSPSSQGQSGTATLKLTLEVTSMLNAFPGQIVQFSLPITGTPLPMQPGTGILSGTEYNTYGTVYVNVMFNSTAYVTVPTVFGMVGTTVYLNGSYLAPNAAAGTYYTVSYNWTQSYSSGSFSGGTPSGTESFSISGTAAGTSTLTIVTGSGALLIAISTQGIATLITDTINSAMKVPISELNAVITSLNSTSVKITTAFGNMTTTLAAIKANVTSVVSGVAVLSTELGNVQTSLASLNATIVSLNGTTATLSTSLGQVKTSLSGINATVTSINNGVATVQTSLGTLTGTVTAMNGTVATISTNVGTIQTTVGQVKTYTSGFSTLEIFLIVAIVLILITLVIASLAVSSSNKVARKIEEQKKQ